MSVENHVISLLTLCLCLFSGGLSAAEDPFPVAELSIAEQNEMMEKYCVICHLDTQMNGGLSLEQFDAATVSPPLAAILASKFTTGVPLEKLLRPELDAETIREIELGKRFGAPSVMEIAGLPLPSEAEINGFIMAMAQRSTGIERWHVNDEGGSLSGDVARVRSYPVRDDQAARDVTFRLVVNCESEGSGQIVLTWSPVPANGEIEVIVDENAPEVFLLDEQEAMANGDPGMSAPSSLVLLGVDRRDTHPAISVPDSRLAITGPLPTAQIEFKLDELWDVEPTLRSCFEN